MQINLLKTQKEFVENLSKEDILQKIQYFNNEIQRMKKE